ncbi:MAG: extracellular solute-binding protein [Anaerolineaceae bacterium]|nr:extracellular solute-binding protein [Anaerolineaceae bacterium]MCB9100863.1 extracellular solute-binding protein [Anaerolineales bacterium]
MIKLKLVHLLFLMSLLVLLAACVPPTPPPSPTPWPTDTPTPDTTTAPAALATPRPTATRTPTLTPPPAVVTIRVWESLPEAQAARLTEDVTAFQAAFPQFQVEVQHYDSSEEFMTSLTAGQLEFEVVLAAAPLLSNLWATEQAAPLADYFPPSFLDAFAGATLAGASRDNQLWGLPDTTGFHLLLFYNRALIDTPPGSVADMVDQAESLTEDTQWGLGLNSYDPIWLLPWLGAVGGWLTDETGEPSLDPAAVEAALELYLGWHNQTRGIAPRQTYEAMRQGFLDGKTAMIIDGEWAVSELSQVENFDWGLARLPDVEGQPATPLILGRYWAINPTVTGDRALAVTAFLEHVTEPERQLAWTTQFGLLPTRREALDDPQITNDPVLRVDAAQMLAGRSAPLGANVNTLLDAMREPLRAALDGQMTAQEAAAAMTANLK